MMLFLFCFQLGGMIKNVSQLYFCQAMFPDASGNYFMNVERFSDIDHAAIQLDKNPDAETEVLEDNETLRLFNELRRKNGKTELSAQGKGI